jgi:hypothetical protein
VRCDVGSQGGQRATLPVTNAGSLDVAVRCKPNTYNNCGAGTTLHEIAAVLYAATVTLADYSVPALANLTGSLFAGGYLTGTRSANFDASDNAGIQSARLYIDGQPQPATSYSCDFTYTVPCSNRSPGLLLDTRALSDGAHTVQVAASDPASNEAKSPAMSITVDNTAPTPPLGLAVAGGSGWHADNAFSVSWTNPGSQVAPIVAGRYRVCTAGGSSCQPEQRVSGQDLTRVDGIAVPSIGEWELQLWLEDAAGNADIAQFAATTLRYGTAPTPGIPPSGAQPPSPTSSTPGAPGPGGPGLAGGTNDAARRSPGLRVTSARRVGARVVIRGRTQTGADGALVVTVRVRGGGLVRRTTRVDGGPFKLVIQDRRLLLGRSVVVRFRGASQYLPSRAALRIRG